MTTKHWLGTAAIILAIGTASGAASAQSEMKHEGGAATASPREAARPGADAKGGAAAAERGASEAKQSAQERRSEPSPAAGREQAQERSSERSSERSGHDAKQPIGQGAESKGERGPASAQRDHDPKESAESKSRADSKQADKPDSKSTAADIKQQQGRADEQRKGEDRAAETKSGATDRKSEAERNGADKNRQSQEERKPGSPDQASDKQNADRNKQANQPGSADNKNTTAQQNQQTAPAGANAGKPDATGQAANQTQADRNRSSTSVSVNDQQRTRVVDQLRRDRDFDRARTDIDIRINVGERLPERVRPRPLPSEIITVVPQYRGYEYTVVHDEIAIIDPRSREIVDVIPENGMRADRGSYGVDRGSYGVERGTRIVLSDEQRQIFFRASTETGTVGSTTSSSSSSSGSTCLSLRRVPDEIARSNPALANYQYLAIGDQVVLVDPQNQKVVQVIDQQQQ